MRSRTGRWTVFTMVVIALSASAFFVFHSEQHSAERRNAMRTFDLRAREASSVLADLRAAEQAYVAAGQGVGVWMPRVAALAERLATGLDELRASAAATDARAALMASGAAIAELGAVDKRAREYIRSGEPLMAADVVFSEGSEVSLEAGHQLETAVAAEHGVFEGTEAAARRLELYALAAGGGLALLTLLLLAPLPDRAQPAHENRADERLESTAPARYDRTADDLPRASAPVLKQTADLCVEIGRVREMSDLTRVLGRTADSLEASGLLVWLTVEAGGKLRAVAAHGYPPQTMARMPAIDRAANNVVAAACRAGTLQIVLARPGISDGAIVAPLLTADGCIGALTAEIKNGAETSDSVQALATIVAAQLSGVLAGSVAAYPPATEARVVAVRSSVM